ncbi:MAG: bacterioferritin [Syntrophaceae bacterium]|nr:bacterioferritin [Syntrophaceae bacterium]
MRQKVINLLNEARSRELSAINQYMIHHYELEDRDFGKLSSKIKEIAIAEMKHAEKLAERILFLKGEPTSKPDATPKKGQEIPEMLATDMAIERQAVKMYNEAAVLCASERDQKSKDLFEELLYEEEKHIHFFESIKNHVDQLGETYLATLTGK